MNAESLPKRARKDLFHLLEEEDDDKTIDICLCLLEVFKRFQCVGIAYNLLTNHRDKQIDPQSFGFLFKELNPHLVFQGFLEIFNYDHSVLLDFLISSETNFLDYLWHYISYLVRTWSDYVIAMERQKDDPIFFEPETDYYEATEQEFGISDGPKKYLHYFVIPKLLPNKVDKTLSCLIRLRYSLDGLIEKGLFPYNISPVLKHLAVLEALYEDLNFEEEEDGIEVQEGFSLV